MSYILAIEFRECDKEIKKYCLDKVSNPKLECSSLMKSCQYPMVANPLCTCNSIKNCCGKYFITKCKDKTYIFYTCKDNCNYFIKDMESAIKNILEPLKSPQIYWGKDLGKLSKEVFGKNKKKR